MTTTIKNSKAKASNHAEDSSPICLPDHDAKIAELAYYKAEKRKFALCYDLDYWLDAYQEYFL